METKLIEETKRPAFVIIILETHVQLGRLINNTVSLLKIIFLCTSYNIAELLLAAA